MRAVSRFLAVVTLSVCLALSSAVAAPGAFVGTWFWQNPIPSGMSVTAFDFAGDAGWAVGSGTVLRSRTGGSMWSAQYGVPSVATRQFRDVEVVDALNVWIASADGALLVTGDGGETWSDRSPSGGTPLHTIEYFGGNEYWVGGSGGLWKTADGGDTWAQLPSPGPWGVGTIYRHGTTIITASGSDIMRFDSGTQAWVRAATLRDGLTDIAFADSNTIVAISDMGSFSRSRDGGQTWSAMKPVSRYAMDLATVFFVSPTVGYCMSNTALVYRTTDSGATWQKYVPTYRNRAGTAVRPSVQPNDVRYANGRWFMMGSSGSIMYSLDKGITWRYVSGDFFTELVDGSFDTTRTGFVLGRDTAYVTSDGGATWLRRALPAVEQYSAVSIAPNGQGWIVGMKDSSSSPGVTGAIFRTTNNGRTFTQQTAPVMHLMNDVWTHDGVTAVATGQYGNKSGILKTVNGGATWTRSTIDWQAAPFQYPEEDRPIYRLTMRPNGLGYAVASNEGFLLRTTDAGSTWSYVGISDPFALYMPDDDNVMIGTWDGVIWRNTQPSLTWTKQTLPFAQGQMVRDISFLTPSIGYALCGDKLYCTDDGGVSWTVTWNSAPFNRILVAGGTDAWGIGSGGTIMYNGGITGDFNPPSTRTSAPTGWNDAELWVGLIPNDPTGVDGTWWAFGEEPTPDETLTAGASVTSAGEPSSSTLAYSVYRGKIHVTSEGVTPITFYSKDSNGNLESPRTIRVRIDRKAPVVRSDARTTYGGSATVKLTAADAGSGVRTVYCSRDGRAPVATAGGTAYVKAGLGTHSVTYWAKDRLGHVSRKVTRRFTVKPRAALTAPSAPVTATAGVAFNAWGYLSPKHSLPAYVVLRTYQEVDGAWIAGASVRAATRNASTRTVYSAKVVLPNAGRWKVVATHSDATHYYSVSPARLTTCVAPSAP